MSNGSNNHHHHHRHHHHHSPTEIPSKRFSPNSEHGMTTPANVLHNPNHQPSQGAMPHSSHHHHHHQNQPHFKSEQIQPTQIKTVPPVLNHQFNTPTSSSTIPASRTTTITHNVLETVAPNRKIDEKLEKMPWFHGLMTRESAEKLLADNGDFLVRETNKVERQYVLSGRYKGECRHIFLVDPSGIVRTKDRTFDNICHLIQYHQENRIPIISKENELLLENPVYK